MSKKIILGVAAGIVAIIVVILLISGKRVASPAVAIGYKLDGTKSGEYSEAIEKFIIGEDMYCCTTVKVVTNKKKMHAYTVEITIPKTKDVEIIKRGGLDAKEMIDDTANECVILRFEVQGSREATEQKMMFKGVPTNEGSATIQVKIYDKKKEIYGYSSTVDFVYGE